METPAPHCLDMPQATVSHFPGMISSDVANRLFAQLRAKAAWRQESIRIQDKTIPLPRLTAWHGDPGTTYGYSGIKNDPAPWFAELEDLRVLSESISSAHFNSALLNLYRDGSDSVAWHCDDEPELGVDPIIVSISLGASRKFSFKHKQDKSLKVDLVLADGDVLIMSGSTQKHWLHQVPKTTKPVGDRMNLTFRLVRPRPAISARPKW